MAQFGQVLAGLDRRIGILEGLSAAGLELVAHDVVGLNEEQGPHQAARFASSHEAGTMPWTASTTGSSAKSAVSS